MAGGSGCDIKKGTTSRKSVSKKKDVKQQPATATTRKKLSVTTKSGTDSVETKPKRTAKVPKEELKTNIKSEKIDKKLKIRQNNLKESKKNEKAIKVIAKETDNVAKKPLNPRKRKLENEDKNSDNNAKSAKLAPEKKKYVKSNAKNKLKFQSNAKEIYKEKQIPKKGAKKVPEVKQNLKQEYKTGTSENQISQKDTKKADVKKITKEKLNKKLNPKTLTNKSQKTVKTASTRVASVKKINCKKTVSSKKCITKPKCSLILSANVKKRNAAAVKRQSKNEILPVSILKKKGTGATKPQEKFRKNKDKQPTEIVSSKKTNLLTVVQRKAAVVKCQNEKGKADNLKTNKIAKTRSLKTLALIAEKAEKAQCKKNQNEQAKDHKSGRPRRDKNPQSVIPISKKICYERDIKDFEEEHTDVSFIKENLKHAMIKGPGGDFDVQDSTKNSKQEENIDLSSPKESPEYIIIKEHSKIKEKHIDPLSPKENQDCTIIKEEPKEGNIILNIQEENHIIKEPIGDICVPDIQTSKSFISLNETLNCTIQNVLHADHDIADSKEVENTVFSHPSESCERTIVDEVCTDLCIQEFRTEENTNQMSVDEDITEATEGGEVVAESKVVVSGQEREVDGNLLGTEKALPEEENCDGEKLTSCEAPESLETELSTANSCENSQENLSETAVNESKSSDYYYKTELKDNMDRKLAMSYSAAVFKKPEDLAILGDVKLKGFDVEDSSNTSCDQNLTLHKNVKNDQYFSELKEEIERNKKFLEINSVLEELKENVNINVNLQAQYEACSPKTVDDLSMSTKLCVDVPVNENDRIGIKEKDLKENQEPVSLPNVDENSRNDSNNIGETIEEEQEVKFTEMEIINEDVLKTKINLSSTADVDHLEREVQISVLGDEHALQDICISFSSVTSKCSEKQEKIDTGSTLHTDFQQDCKQKQVIQRNNGYHGENELTTRDNHPKPVPKDKAQDIKLASKIQNTFESEEIHPQINIELDTKVENNEGILLNSQSAEDVNLCKDNENHLKNHIVQSDTWDGKHVDLRLQTDLEINNEQMKKNCISVKCDAEDEVIKMDNIDDEPIKLLKMHDDNSKELGYQKCIEPKEINKQVEIDSKNTNLDIALSLESSLVKDCDKNGKIDLKSPGEQNDRCDNPRRQLEICHIMDKNTDFQNTKSCHCKPDTLVIAETFATSSKCLDCEPSTKATFNSCLDSSAFIENKTPAGDKENETLHVEKIEDSESELLDTKPASDIVDSMNYEELNCGILKSASKSSETTSCDKIVEKISTEISAIVQNLPVEFVASNKDSTEHIREKGQVPDVFEKIITMEESYSGCVFSDLTTKIICNDENSPENVLGTTSDEIKKLEHPLINVKPQKYLETDNFLMNRQSSCHKTFVELSSEVCSNDDTNLKVGLDSAIGSDYIDVVKRNLDLNIKTVTCSLDDKKMLKAVDTNFDKPLPIETNARLKAGKETDSLDSNYLMGIVVNSDELVSVKEDNIPKRTFEISSVSKITFKDPSDTTCKLTTDDEPEGGQCSELLCSQKCDIKESFAESVEPNLCEITIEKCIDSRKEKNSNNFDVWNANYKKILEGAAESEKIVLSNSIISKENSSSLESENSELSLNSVNICSPDRIENSLCLETSSSIKKDNDSANVDTVVLTLAESFENFQPESNFHINFTQSDYLKDDKEKLVQSSVSSKRSEAEEKISSETSVAVNESSSLERENIQESLADVINCENGEGKLEMTKVFFTKSSEIDETIRNDEKEMILIQPKNASQNSSFYHASELLEENGSEKTSTREKEGTKDLLKDEVEEQIELVQNSDRNISPNVYKNNPNAADYESSKEMASIVQRSETPDKINFEPQHNEFFDSESTFTTDKINCKENHCIVSLNVDPQEIANTGSSKNCVDDIENESKIDDIVLPESKQLEAKAVKLYISNGEELNFFADKDSGDSLDQTKMSACETLQNATEVKGEEGDLVSYKFETKTSIPSSVLEMKDLESLKEDTANRAGSLSVQSHSRTNETSSGVAGSKCTQKLKHSAEQCDQAFNEKTNSVSKTPLKIKITRNKTEKVSSCEIISSESLSDEIKIACHAELSQENTLSGASKMDDAEPGPSSYMKSKKKRKKKKVSSSVDRKRLRMTNPEVPVRPYLEQFVPLLMEGLLKVTYERPNDPIQYLADWMTENKTLAYKRMDHL